MQRTVLAACFLTMLGTATDASHTQLLAMGRSLYEAEGLTPYIPPPPVLCNTVEGGHCCDLLDKQGQARNDLQMLRAALSVLSQALAPIARVAPPMEGAVLVSITQFLPPLGRTIDQIITPFFENKGYNHFKAPRAQLDGNLGKTNRTNPIYTHKKSRWLPPSAVDPR